MFARRRILGLHRRSEREDYQLCALQLLVELKFLQRLVDRTGQNHGVDRLLREIVVGAVAHRLGSEPLIAITGEHYHGRNVDTADEPFEEGQSVLSGQVVIEQDEVKRVLGESIDGVISRVQEVQDEVRPGILTEHGPNDFYVVRVIVDHQEPDSFLLHSRAPTPARPMEAWRSES